MEEELDKNNGRDMTPRLIKDLGMRFPTEKSSRKYRYGLFECQYCNKEFEAITSSIKIKNTVSCGCHRAYILTNIAKKTHGLTSHKYYQTWYDMIKRCNNPKATGYKHYGGRGITVCEEWLDIANFIVWCDLTHPNIEGLSLDRIDVDGNYEPNNCRWADASTQALNQRMKGNNTSGFVGVAYRKDNNKWSASITIDCKVVFLRCFKTKEEAVEARDNYIIENNLPHKLSSDYNKD